MRNPLQTYKKILEELLCSQETGKICSPHTAKNTHCCNFAIVREGCKKPEHEAESLASSSFTLNYAY
jgi:hypothetical protein